jgi:hypothetical protein
MQLLFTFLVVISVTKTNADPADFRPPAVPLIVFSPHISGESDLYFTHDTRKQHLDRKRSNRTDPFLQLNDFI